MGTPIQSVDGTLNLRGTVHGGQNGVVGAAIHLYTVGTSGLGTASRDILTLPVTTGAYGTFGLTNDYHCNSSTDQMYVEAVGGDPGFGSSNPAIVLVTALGDCGNLNANTYITVNEVTTAAAAWAIGQFAVDGAHIGATSTNATGIRNAFLDAKLIADSGFGTTATLASNLTTETGKIYALADALAPCVNSTGSSGSGTPCGNLYAAASGGGTPSNVFNAALNIVQHPGTNVVGVWNCIDANAPFPTTLTQAPADWTLSLTATGGGLGLPTTLGIDASGNVWVADYNGGLSAFTPQAAPFSSTAYGTSNLAEVYGLAVDLNGNIWLTNEQAPYHSPTQGSIVKFSGVGGTAGSYIGTYYDGSIDFPESIFADANGYIDIGNYANGTATIYDNSGNLLVAGVGTGSFPVSITSDGSHGVWYANSGSNTITHVAFTTPSNIASSATTVTEITGCCSASNAVAADSGGNVWSANYSGSTISEVSSANTTLIAKQAFTGAGSPAGLAIDAKQNVWILNYRGNTISEVSGYNSTTPGTTLSPNPGYGSQANLSEPFWMEVDASGNMWVSNYANNDLVMFFGLAAPTSTPLLASPTAP